MTLTEQIVDIPTGDGAMNTFVVWPETGAPCPVVLFYMDAFGLRPELQDMARRMAGWGYLVVLPNLYYRTAREFVMKPGEDGMAAMRAMMGQLSNSLVTGDTAAMLAFADKDPKAASQHIGAVGYCMSGPFVISAAAAYPDRLTCIASIHGANMVTDRPDSAHLVASRLRCETYVACAEIDKWATPAEMSVLEAQLKASGTAYAMEWYGGAHHGFVFPNRVGAYSEPAAERHWQRLQDLFGRRLSRRA